MKITNKMIYDELLLIKEFVRQMELSELIGGKSCDLCEYWKESEEREDPRMGICYFNTNEPCDVTEFCGCEHFKYKKDL